MTSLQPAQQADKRDAKYFAYLKQMLLKAHRIIESYEPSSEFCVQLHSFIRALPVPPREEAENNTTTVFKTHLPSEPFRNPTGSLTTSNPAIQDKASLKFVIYKPTEDKPTEDNSATRIDYRWKKELNIFLSNIPETEKWGSPPPREKILRLLLCRKVRFDKVRLDGDGSGARDDDGDDDREDDGQDEWDERCRAYASSTAEAMEINSVFRGILAFRVIIVALACVVMLENGAELADAESILKTCIPTLSTAMGRTLAQNRHAAKWVNSQILELRKVGWGDRSAEVFLLYGQSISKFRLICSNTCSGDAFIAGMKKKGKPIPKLGDNEMPISIPCIVKRCCGKSASLRKVCEVLSYDFREVHPLYKEFYASRDDLDGESDGPEYAAECPSESNISGYEAHTSGSEAPTLCTSSLGTGRDTDEPAANLETPTDAAGDTPCANGPNRWPHASIDRSEYQPSQQRRQDGEVDETSSATESSTPSTPSQDGNSIATRPQQQAGSWIEGGPGQQCDSQPRAKRRRTDDVRGGQTSSVSGSIHSSQNAQNRSQSDVVGHGSTNISTEWVSTRPETTNNGGQQANNLSGFRLQLPSLSVRPNRQHSDYSTQTLNQRSVEPYTHQAGSAPTVNVYANSQRQNQHQVQQTRNTSLTHVAPRAFTPTPSNNSQAYNLPTNRAPTYAPPVQGFLDHQTMVVRQTPAAHTATIGALLNTNEEATINTGVGAPVNSFDHRGMPISWGDSQHQRQARQTHSIPHSLGTSTQHRLIQEVRGQVEGAASTNNPVAIHTAYTGLSDTDYNGQQLAAESGSLPTATNHQNNPYGNRGSYSGTGPWQPSSGFDPFSATRYTPNIDSWTAQQSNLNSVPVSLNTDTWTAQQSNLNSVPVSLNTDTWTAQQSNLNSMPVSLNTDIWTAQPNSFNSLSTSTHS
ncbi:hypothetical protein H112_07917 [Trichophyton rubrum D6]|uniref:Uncharacterized protein n=2 Tax=Trichophyton rubrum TaxID=5551 RepID=F2SBV1_TRIRC|nr:uncharacterized protein TERG_00509 [Trichophyton rubrum CBS 118892]EZF10890.1 hypothetical protein H100_07944 [Trichophyton rubrum MR850]EZF48272.1 hypothetical protein H103_07929 [Trichophyton rubrum CBS 288.86]EZF80326.1 hypothetical protein H110_07928 [Trichophyton rubrum MR1448]EZF90809.1 hypothetical protein H113_07991 [Trichophyton rubrum MR1459]EZG12547.1 hypothetical protein H107_08069 [Trichophyton rubrum CBS 202.88]KDB29425.1 hypothetical protein H112_07917 [Trichophyton rubrum D